MSPAETVIHIKNLKKLAYDRIDELYYKLRHLPPEEFDKDYPAIAKEIGDLRDQITTFDNGLMILSGLSNFKNEIVKSKRNERL